MVILIGAVLLWAARPAAAEPSGPSCLSGIPRELYPFWQQVCSGERRNAILDHLRAGFAAFATGHDELAERSLDFALSGIEQIYADGEAAEKARSLWYGEDVKDFKGEPYERVMAYYYRGLLYLGKGDWENAQASFQGGVLQDTFAEQDRYQADVASLMWLAGWANRCRGNRVRAAELFSEAGAIRPALKPPLPGETILVIAETGHGPIKRSGGRFGEKLVIREGFVLNYGLTAALGGSRKDLVPAEDLFFQATTRGGRAVDGILAEKADTKAMTQAVGKSAFVVGASGLGSYNKDASLAGAAVLIAGLVTMAVAEGMEAAADIRMWETLPHTINLAAMALPPDTRWPLRLDLYDPAGRPVLADPALVRTWSSGSCRMVWNGAYNTVPSLAVGGGGEGVGNCRTSSGGRTMLDPEVCRRIGGEALK